MKDYKIGDKVWFTKTFEEIYWKSGSFRPNPTTHPFEKKITQIVETNTGKLYQVKGGHFHESMIGRIVFDSKEEAENAIQLNNEKSKIIETSIINKSKEEKDNRMVIDIMDEVRAGHIITNTIIYREGSLVNVSFTYDNTTKEGTDPEDIKNLLDMCNVRYRSHELRYLKSQTVNIED